MQILIAEDDKTSRILLASLLEKWGHDVVVTCDGNEAWQVMKADDAPDLAILDWMMPGIDGIELCRRIRKTDTARQPHIILLTAMGDKEDIVVGLYAGADDYVTKPFSREELHARIRVAQRIIDLQQSLRVRVVELEAALRHVKTLQGVVPICMHCHKIRREESSWQKLEDYIQENSSAEFSHGLCDDCLEKYYPKDGADDEVEPSGDSGFDPQDDLGRVE